MSVRRAGVGLVSSALHQRLRVRRTRTSRWVQTPVVWIAALLGAICFEGVGRKMYPEIPPQALYLLKDVVLLAGVWLFGVRKGVRIDAAWLMRGFLPFVGCAIVWTVLELLNPDMASIQFGLLGLRSYWLWWVAPMVVASALSDDSHERRAVVVLAVLALIVAVYAALQFSLPASDPLNAYASGVDPAAVATVASTGRVRVTSTFSYISGFTAFVTIVPALLLAVGLSATGRAERLLTLGGAVVCAMALPMSGSRAAVLAGGGGLLLVAFGAGLVRTRIGRRVTMAGAVAVAAAVWFSPEAVEGVGDRFGYGETDERFAAALEYIPPLALFMVEYPALGMGTGMMQNAAQMYGLERRYVTEYEPGRYLLELGAPGYLLISIVRIGLAIALVRAGRDLKRSGHRGEAGGAYAFAGLSMVGNLVFDHVWQALFFVGCGLILSAHLRAVSRPARPPG